MLGGPAQGAGLARTQIGAPVLQVEAGPEALLGAPGLLQTDLERRQFGLATGLALGLGGFGQAGLGLGSGLGLRPPGPPGFLGDPGQLTQSRQAAFELLALAGQLFGSQGPAAGRNLCGGLPGLAQGLGGLHASLLGLTERGLGLLGGLDEAGTPGLLEGPDLVCFAEALDLALPAIPADQLGFSFSLSHSKARSWRERASAASFSSATC